MPLHFPEYEIQLNGMLHRKWVYHARRYGHGDGVQSERWVYGVGEKPFVVTFSVATGRYPEGYDAYRPSAPYAIAETLHRVGDGDHSCIYLDGQNCGNDGSGIDADAWYAAQPKNAEGLVADADVFAHLRDLYTLWNKT
jgi:hypothetical protein